MKPRSRRRRLGLLLPWLVLGVVVSGCGSAQAPAGGPIVRVTERDFHITVPARIKAGPVVFRVHNLGPDDHEFIVVRLGAGVVPLRPDGMSVNEEKLASSTVVSLEPGQPGSVRDVSVDLAPGRYEVLCNMEGHFMGGMHDQLVAAA